MSGWTPIEASAVSQRTSNPIRKIVDQMQVDIPVDKQPKLALSIGDPTLHHNLLPPEETKQWLMEAIESANFNGYAPSMGHPAARAAVAASFAHKYGPAFTAQDVCLSSGCSHAIEMAIGALCNEGDNLLLPQPGFSLYRTVCDNKGIEPRYYQCVPENNYEVDLESMRKIVDKRTRAILINNPSNPCGSNFAKAHVEAIIAIAEEFKLPIISDEIYAGLTFPKEGTDTEFYSVAQLSKTVPCIIAGGLAKVYVVPGWRMGWLVIHDPVGALGNIRAAMAALSTLIVGPNLLIQSVLPKLLAVPQSPAMVQYAESLRSELSKAADASFKYISAIEGLQPIQPQGAMYMMVKIDGRRLAASVGGGKDVADDVVFSRRLLEVEGVEVLPGACFQAPGFFRVVFTSPIDVLEKAYGRIKDFCDANRA